MLDAEKRNSHPQSSGVENDFVVVHNGIITNYKTLKQMLIRKGYEFESDTDTEVIPKLAKYLYDMKDKPVSFFELVTEVSSLLWDVQRVPCYSSCSFFTLSLQVSIS